MAAGAATAGKAVLESGKAAAGVIGAAAKGLPTKAVEIAEAAKGSVSKVAGAAQTGVAKVVKSEVVKDTGKLISESIAKRLPKAALKAAGKSIPGIGALIGLGAAAVSLAEGDKVAAGLEAVSGLGSAATAIPATAALVAKEVYEDVYGIKPEDDPEAGARLTEVKTQVWEEMKKLTGTEEPKAEETPKEDAGKLLEGIKPEDKQNADKPDVKTELGTDVKPNIAPEMVAGIPIVKGQPLTKEQIAATDIAIKLGNKPSVDVKEAYDLAKGNKTETTVNGQPVKIPTDSHPNNLTEATVNGQPVKAEPVTKDYNTEFKKVEEERVKAAKQFSESSNTEEDIKIFKEQLSKVEDMKVNLLAERDNKPRTEIRKMLEDNEDPTTSRFYQLKPTAERVDSSKELIKASTESEDAKMTTTGGGDSGTTIISPTTITNSNQTNVVRKDVKNNDGSLNRLFDSRYKFNS